MVFGVKDELIAKIEKRTDPAMPDGKPMRHAVASDDLRIPDETWRGNRAEAARREGGGRRLKADRSDCCSILVRRTRIERTANFGCGVPLVPKTADRARNQL